MSDTIPTARATLDPRPRLPVSRDAYLLCSQRGRAWLSRAAQVRAGVELQAKRPVTDELLAHLTKADIDRLWGTEQE